MSTGHVTVAQLLSHTSGLQAETEGPWWERNPGGHWRSLSETLALRHPPGQRFHYSNGGFAVLGELISRIRGHSVHPYSDLTLPEPEHDAGAMGPAGQLWSTVHDLAIWAAFLAGDTRGLLQPDTLARMRVPMALDDETGDAVVLFANSTAGTSPGFDANLLTEFGTAHPHPPAPWHPRTSDTELLELVGHWYWGPAGLELRVVDNDVLRLAPISSIGGFGRVSRFRRTGADSWVGLGGYFADEPLTVVRGPDSQAHHLDLASFRLSRQPYEVDADIPGGVDPAGWR